MAFSFEKLLVYQKAVDFADQICTHVLLQSKWDKQLARIR